VGVTAERVISEKRGMKVREKTHGRKRTDGQSMVIRRIRLTVV